MVVRRGDTVPNSCNHTGLIESGMIAQPAVDGGSGTLSTDPSRTGKLIQRVSDVEGITGLHSCEGVDVLDDYQPNFQFHQVGRIIRGYVSKSTSTCNAPRTFDPTLGLDSDGYFTESTDRLVFLVTIISKVYSFFSTIDEWTLPIFAGQKWRITEQAYPYTSVASIFLEGNIDVTGFPTGLTLRNLAPGIFLLDFTGKGLHFEDNPDYPTGGPSGPLNLGWRYKLFYGCDGAWFHVNGITPW